MTFRELANLITENAYIQKDLALVKTPGGETVDIIGVDAVPVSFGRDGKEHGGYAVLLTKTRNSA